MVLTGSQFVGIVFTEVYTHLPRCLKMMYILEQSTYQFVVMGVTLTIIVDYRSTESSYLISDFGDGGFRHFGAGASDPVDDLYFPVCSQIGSPLANVWRMCKIALHRHCFTCGMFDICRLADMISHHENLTGARQRQMR